MNINVLDIIDSKFATNYNDGVAIFEVIKNYQPSDLTISFKGVRRISTLFLNECIGRYVRLHPLNIHELKFEYPMDKEIFAYKVDEVIENTLMGEEYDTLVDNALHSL